MFGSFGCVEPLESREIDYELGVGEFACNFKLVSFFLLEAIWWLRFLVMAGQNHIS